MTPAQVAKAKELAKKAGRSYPNLIDNKAAMMATEESSKRPGLWANIHAKRERIKHGSGEHMRKPGEKGRPTAANFRSASMKEDAEKHTKNPALPSSRFDASDELVAIYKHDTPGQTPDKRRIQIVKKAVKEALGIEEADYHGRSVSLNKPMKGDIKKSKVYVKDPKSGNIKKVEFGDPNMTIKKHIPARRKSFRARHHCDTNPGPKTKARYWSCRAW